MIQHIYLTNLVLWSLKITFFNTNYTFISFITLLIFVAIQRANQKMYQQHTNCLSLPAGKAATGLLVEYLKWLRAVLKLTMIEFRREDMLRRYGVLHGGAGIELTKKRVTLIFMAPKGFWLILNMYKNSFEEVKI